MYEIATYLVAILITVGFPLYYFWRHQKKEREAREKLSEATSTGRTEPISLHPKIDPNRCIGAGACVKACPEGEILGTIHGKAALVSPTKCIGHGACQAACPVDAIELVFGTERRGIEIPYLKSNFETNMRGLYIAGELGGMGLIRNAITQGREAVEYLAATLEKSDKAIYDVAIVGAGPAGFAATLQAQKQGLRYVTFDQSDLGGTILTYPRQKIVMTQPMNIPIYGKFNARQIRKEELIGLFEGIAKQTGTAIHANEKLETLKRVNGHYEVTTSKGSYLAQRIVLAIGRRGTPRKLGVPGEVSAKVAYKLLEPEQYRGMRALVVGGGDSAVEAALALANQPGTEVTLSYRKAVLTRTKQKNLEAMERAIAQGRIRALFESNVTEILEDRVYLQHGEKHGALKNDYVFIFAGGELPTGFLQKLGIRIEMKFGEK